MRFFEYKKGNIQPLTYPMTSTLSDEKNCFLIYAEDDADAKKTADEHLTGKPFETLHNFQYKRDVCYKMIENVAVSEAFHSATNK